MYVRITLANARKNANLEERKVVQSTISAVSWTVSVQVYMMVLSFRHSLSPGRMLSCRCSCWHGKQKLETIGHVKYRAVTHGHAEHNLKKEEPRECRLA